MTTSTNIQAVLVYDDIEASHRFLVTTFGFEPGELHRGADGTVVHGEVSTGSATIWMHRVTREHGLDSPNNLGHATGQLVVYVDDVDDHHQRVTAAGGRPTTAAPVDQPYGLRDYSVFDNEGHLWTFATPLRDRPAERPTNAVERFLAASRGHDVSAAAAELAPDVVMLNPASDDPVVGRDAVAAALGAVDRACDEFRHTHLLVDTSSGPNPLFALVFEARVGDARLRGVDLVEIDRAVDRIATFTVAVRPIAGLMALGARMSANP